MFKIGDFSKLTWVSVRMLRYYDETGLFKPCKVDKFTGYRYYSAKQIEDLSFIVSLRDLGFTVVEIVAVIDEKSRAKQKEMLRAKHEAVRKSIEDSNKILNKIDSAIENIDKEKIKMNYNVKTKKIPSYKVLSYREKIPAYSDEGMLWGKLGEYMGKKGMKTDAFCYATYHDIEYKESDVDVEVVMEVIEMGNDDGAFVYKNTEPVELAASVLVAGDYSNIASAFAFLAEWIEESDYEMCGLMRQVPIKGPWNEDDVENYLTELQVPIRKA